MTITDIIQWGVQLVLAVLVTYLAFKKAPSERSSLNGSATKAYAEAAKIAGENARIAEESARKSAEELATMEKEHEIEIVGLKTRLDILERKQYRITIDFTIGEPPTVGIVKIEPMITIDSKEDEK